MNQQAEELKARTRRFLLDVIARVKTFPMTVDADIIGRQLIKAAAGVAGITGVRAAPDPTPRSRRKSESSWTKPMNQSCG